MLYQEIYQLMKYKRDELSARLSTIQQDFNTDSPVDDVLFAIAHQTKVELVDVKNIIADIEQGRFGLCQQCHQPIGAALLQINPFAVSCENCKSDN